VGGGQAGPGNHAVPHGHGVSTSKAVRIYKAYGDQAIGKVRNNPYVLAKDIYGIGFKTADQIAQNVGIPKDSLARASAGIDHVLLEATTEGHCALPVAQLTASAVKLLAVGEGTVEQGLSQMITSGSLLLEMIRGESLVFLPHLRKAEEGIAAKVRALVEAPPVYPPIKCGALQARPAIRPAHDQAMDLPRRSVRRSELILQPAQTFADSLHQRPFLIACGTR
jgi:ATP-dependent exoDNAse (exonuclease V) alpha subunit